MIKSLLLHWKIVLALTGIFATGAVTGVTVQKISARRAMAQQMTSDQPDPELQKKMDKSSKRWTGRTMKRMTERLELTSEQQEKIKPILEESASELTRVQEESRREMRRIIDESRTRINAHLTPEQQARHNELIAKFKKSRTGTDSGSPRKPGEKLQNFMKEHDRDGDGLLNDTEKNALPPRARMLFNRLDENGDGRINDSERQKMKQFRHERLSNGPENTNPEKNENSL